MLYSLSKVDRVYHHSLVDYSTNGRVTSEDVYVKFIYSNWKVNVHSIDNHKIISVLLVTARGVTYSTIRDIIIVLY